MITDGRWQLYLVLWVRLDGIWTDTLRYSFTFSAHFTRNWGQTNTINFTVFVDSVIHHCSLIATRSILWLTSELQMNRIQEMRWRIGMIQRDCDFFRCMCFNTQEANVLLLLFSLSPSSPLNTVLEDGRQVGNRYLEQDRKE